MCFQRCILRPTAWIQDPGLFLSSQLDLVLCAGRSKDRFVVKIQEGVLLDSCLYPVRLCHKFPVCLSVKDGDNYRPSLPSHLPELLQGLFIRFHDDAKPHVEKTCQLYTRRSCIWCWLVSGSVLVFTQVCYSVHRLSCVDPACRCEVLCLDLSLLRILPKDSSTPVGQRSSSFLSRSLPICLVFILMQFDESIWKDCQVVFMANCSWSCSTMTFRMGYTVP